MITKQLMIGGTVLHSHILGQRDRAAVVLVHGIGVSSRYFTPLAKRLAESYSVYVLDLPGYGTTPKPSAILNVAELGDIVKGTLRQLQLTDVVLVGHSMGCQIIAHAASGNTDVAKLIMVGPTVNEMERTCWWQGFRLFQDTFREPWWVNHIIFSEYIKMGPRRYLTTSRYMVKDKLERTLSSVSQPVYLVRGESDTIASHEWVRYLAAQHATTKAVEVAGGAHAVHMTHAEEVATWCQRFITGS